MAEPISADVSQAVRALQTIAAYDCLRLATYRDCESANARIRIEQAYGASLLRFEDVGYFNRVFTPTDAIAGHLDEVEAYYRDSRFGCELMTASAGQWPLAEACSQRGWLPCQRYAWMHMNIGRAEISRDYPGISIRSPRMEERREFLEFYLRGFEAPAGSFPAAIRNMRHLFDLPQLHFLIASHEGMDVAIGILCVFGETALLAAGTTLPTQRMNGYHHAVLAARIRLAQQLGCTDIVSFAYAGGQSHLNMESMGLLTANITQSWRFPGAVH